MVENSVLPEWLKKLLPEVKPEARVSVTADRTLFVTFTDGSTAEVKDLPALGEIVHGIDFTIDDEVYEAFSEDAIPGFGLSFPSSKNTVRMLLPHGDRARLSILERAYETSLRCHIRYQANPNDFVTAYRFISTHPAFWTCHDLEKHPWHWETDGHAQHVSQYVYRDDDGSVVVSLETGQHVPYEDAHWRTAYSSHYHDYRLDVYAATFEEAFVQLAANVDKFFYPDGSEKPDVPHEKPDWIIELEERIREYDEED